MSGGESHAVWLNSYGTAVAMGLETPEVRLSEWDPWARMTLVRHRDYAR